MKNVKVTVLRQKLPQYLARVRRGSVRRYERPLAPVLDPAEWDANR